jgi:serine/threonine-protein kinase ATR
MPLNEECGLLEWVANTNAFKNILEAGYARHGRKLYTSELHNTVETSRKQGTQRQIDAFCNIITPMYVSKPSQLMAGSSQPCLAIGS